MLAVQRYLTNTDILISYPHGSLYITGALIEKDYYCSLLLKEIFQSEDCNFVFKGGDSS